MEVKREKRKTEKEIMDAFRQLLNKRQEIFLGVVVLFFFVGLLWPKLFSWINEIVPAGWKDSAALNYVIIISLLAIALSIASLIAGRLICPNCDKAINAFLSRPIINPFTLRPLDYYCPKCGVQLFDKVRGRG